MPRLPREGAPYLAVLVVVVLACAGLLALAATRDDRGARGFATFTATQNGCELNPGRALNALDCFKVGEGEYRISFNASLDDSTPLVTRTTNGDAVSARVEDERAVVVIFPESEAYPATASVFLP